MSSCSTNNAEQQQQLQHGRIAGNSTSCGGAGVSYPVVVSGNS